MFFHLNKKEDIFLLVFSSATVLYALLEFYRFGNEYEIQDGYGVKNGWTILNRNAMEFDTDYTQFFSYVSSSFLWLIAHCLICEATRYVNAKNIPLFHAIVGIPFFLSHKVWIVMISIPMSITFYLAMRTTRKSIVYSTFIFWIGVAGAMKIARKTAYFPESITFQDFFDGLTLYYWLSMRLVSFALDYCDEYVGPSKAKENHLFHQKFSVTKFLGFNFYLPVLSQGPPLLFSNYAQMVEANSIRKNNDFQHRIIQLAIALIRVAVISFIALFMMHGLYTEPIMYDEDLRSVLAAWPLYGMVISTALYFCLVYMLKYQLGSALAQFDRINAPPKPKCCFGLHRSGSLWRHFDVGMYNFSLKYIYIPINKLKSNWNKLGRVLVFVFITCWHCIGNQMYIFVWVWGNFALLCIEGLNIKKTSLYIRVSKVIGSNDMNRIDTFVGGQMMILVYCLAMAFLTPPRTFLYIFHQVYLNNTLLSYMILSAATYSLYHNGRRICHIYKNKSKDSKIPKEHEK